MTNKKQKQVQGRKLQKRHHNAGDLRKYRSSSSELDWTTGVSSQFSSYTDSIPHSSDALIFDSTIPGLTQGKRLTFTSATHSLTSSAESRRFSGPISYNEHNNLAFKNHNNCNTQLKRLAGSGGNCPNPLFNPEKFSQKDSNAAEGHPKPIIKCTYPGNNINPGCLRVSSTSINTNRRIGDFYFRRDPCPPKPAINNCIYAPKFAAFVVDADIRKGSFKSEEDDEYFYESLSSEDENKTEKSGRTLRRPNAEEHPRVGRVSFSLDTKGSATKADVKSENVTKAEFESGSVTKTEFESGSVTKTEFESGSGSSSSNDTSKAPSGREGMLGRNLARISENSSNEIDTTTEAPSRNVSENTSKNTSRYISDETEDISTTTSRTTTGKAPSRSTTIRDFTDTNDDDESFIITRIQLGKHKNEDPIMKKKVALAIATQTLGRKFRNGHSGALTIPTQTPRYSTAASTKVGRSTNVTPQARSAKNSDRRSGVLSSGPSFLPPRPMTVTYSRAEEAFLSLESIAPPSPTETIEITESYTAAPPGKVRYGAPWPGVPIIDKSGEYDKKGVNVDVSQQSIPGDGNRSSTLGVSFNGQSQGTSTIHSAPKGRRTITGNMPGRKSGVTSLANYPYYEGTDPSSKRTYTFKPHGDGMPIVKRFTDNNGKVHIRQHPANGMADTVGGADGGPVHGRVPGDMYDQEDLDGGGYDYGINNRYPNNNKKSNTQSNKKSAINNGNYGPPTGKQRDPGFGPGSGKGHNPEEDTDWDPENDMSYDPQNMGYDPGNGMGNGSGNGMDNGYGNGMDNGSGNGNGMDFGPGNGMGFGAGPPQCCNNVIPVPYPIPYPMQCPCPPPPPPCPPPCPPPPCCCSRRKPKKKKKKKKDCDKQWDMMSMYGMYTLFQQMFSSWQNQMTEQYERSRPKQPPQYAVVMANPCQVMSMMGGGCCGSPPIIVMPDGGGGGAGMRSLGGEPNPLFEVTGVEVRNDSKEC